MSELIKTDEYEHGAVEFRVYKYKNPLQNTFLIKVGGVSYIEMRESELLDLHTILDAYVSECYGRAGRKRWFKRGK